MHHTQHSERETRSVSHLYRALIASLTTIMVVAFGIALPATAQANDAPAVTLNVNYGTDSNQGTTVVTPGTSYNAQIRYDASKIVPGSTLFIDVPEGIVFPSGVPVGNSVVESVVLTDTGDLEVTFKAEPDTSIAQGVLGVQFTFTEPVNGSAEREVTWTVAGVNVTKNLIVKSSGDTFRPDLTPSFQKNFPSDQAKNTAEAGLRAAVSRNVNTGIVTLNPTVTATPIPYSIRVVSEAARTVTVTDTVSDFLAFNTDSFEATLTTWDDRGLNQQTVPFTLPSPAATGQTVTLADIALPENSILNVTYTANVAAAQVSALHALLQQRADALAEKDTNGDGGWYSVALENSASIGDVPVKRSLNISGSIPQEARPGLGGSIAKNASLPNTTLIELDADGRSLATPLDVTYNISVSLKPWAGFAGTRHELKRNVIVHDTLPASMQWAPGTFVTVAAGNMVLTPAAADVTTDAFQSDAGVGTYRVIQDGKRLEINIGRDTTQQYAFAAQVKIVSIDGMRSNKPGTRLPQIETVYTASNRAFFDYSDTLADTFSTRENALHVPKAPGSVIDDATEFSKTVGDLEQMTKGEAFQVPFSFSVAAGAVPDLRVATIVDDINDEVFDLSDLNAIQSSITGTYANAGGLTGSDFDLRVTDGDLLITLSDSFGANLPVAQQPAADAVLNQALTLKMNIPTFTVTGKQTFDVSNSARLIHSGVETYTWTSEAVASATSYGDELEVNKFVYTADGNWASGVRVELDQNGKLVNDKFVYRVNVIPHGEYFGFEIIDLVDVLPEGLKLLGFVSDSQLGTGNFSSTTESLNLGANLRATLNIDANTVTIQQRPGTVLPKGATASVNFMVQITDFTEDIAIVNRIAGAAATITPSAGYPLNIEKIDDTRDGVIITDRDARFTVTDPAGDVVTDEAYVVNGQLVVADADGKDTSIVIPEGQNGAVPSGVYTITEQEAPEGYALSDAEVTVTIRPNGTATSAKFYNTPLDLFAVGDVVWIDENRDGLQTEGEPRLEGVTVTLINNDTNETVATTTTNEQGEYLFDLLPAGDYRVSFALTPEQAEEYVFTTPLSGENAALNSDANPATGETGVISLNAANDNRVSANDYTAAPVRALNGIDPTWDAGVVKRTIAVGDYVWIDANRNGLQDDGEAALPGVTVELLNGDGTPAVNVRGEAVAPVATDATGRYLFDNLTEGDYQVRFTLTPEHALQYAFTEPAKNGVGQNSDAEVSDTDERVATTPSFTLNRDSDTVTRDYDRDVLATEGIDPTWDAGVVLRAVSVGDLVWLDTNNNGRQTLGEPGIPGVVLELTGPTGDPVTDVFGNPVTPQTTDADGHYRFVNLPVLADGQSYTVTINREASVAAIGELQPTTAGRGERAGDSSEWSAASQGLTAHNQSDLTLDFGFVQSVSLGDRVWIDRNFDGLQTPGEPGIPGVVITLTGPTGDPVTDVFGNPVTPQTTDADGNFRFVNLPVLEEGQSYTVTIDREASAGALGNLQPTQPEAGDRDNDSSEWESSSTGLTGNNQSDLTLDFGFVESVAVGDRVWIDTNRDGLQTEGEPGVPGVVLELTGPTGAPVTDVFGNPVTPQTTDADGHYRFVNLPVLADGQSYTVTINRDASAEALTNLQPTAAGSGDRELDSSDWSAPSVGLTQNGESDLTLDFGFLESVSVGDLVWLDSNGDGRQNRGEPGIPGVVLELTGPTGDPVTDVFGNPVAPQTTDADGHYRFVNLPVLEEGQAYTVTIDREASAAALTNLLPTGSEVGDREGDSALWVALSQGLTANGERDLTLDFGFVTPAAAAAASPNDGSLSETGAAANLPLIGGSLAALLLALGAGFMLVSRRRQA